MDDVCKHGETGICLGCPVLMREIRTPGEASPALALLPARRRDPGHRAMSIDLQPAIDPDDPPEDWFFEWGDTRPWRSVRQMIQDWWNSLRAD